MDKRARKKSSGYKDTKMEDPIVVPSAEPVLVSYAYYEKSTRRHQENLIFFLHEAVARFANQKHIRIELNINGKCLVPLPPNTENFQAYIRPNVGFDFGAHTDTLHRALDRHKATSFVDLPYKHYIFLNGSQRGPFLPVYWPKGNAWTDVFTSKLVDDTGLVGSSMFYHEHTGSPVVETWAFGLRADALDAVWKSKRIFKQHPSKHSACVAEDELAPLVKHAGLKFTSLLLKFNQNGEKQTNSYKIASRPWAYEDICINPLEVVFYKTFWDTAPESDNYYECPFEARYTQWILGERERSRKVYPIKDSWKQFQSEMRQRMEIAPPLFSSKQAVDTPTKPKVEDHSSKRTSIIVGTSVVALITVGVVLTLVLVTNRK